MNSNYTIEQIRQMVAGVAEVPASAKEANRIIARFCFCDEAAREAARCMFWMIYGIQF